MEGLGTGMTAWDCCIWTALLSPLHPSDIVSQVPGSSVYCLACLPPGPYCSPNIKLQIPPGGVSPRGSPRTGETFASPSIFGKGSLEFPIPLYWRQEHKLGASCLGGNLQPKSRSLILGRHAFIWGEESEAAGNGWSRGHSISLITPLLQISPSSALGRPSTT